jgi:hypothetical protein
MRYPVFSFVRNHLVEIASSLFLFLLCVVATVSLWRQTGTEFEVTVGLHLKELASAIKKIDEDCEILSFAHQKNYVDFLNVKAFSGSEVGALTVKYPKKWAGPYWNDVPTLQTFQYEIVRTRKGYFLVPGDGVKLANGKIIGKDIVLDEACDIPALMDRADALQIIQGNAAAVRLDIKMNRTIEPVLQTDLLLALVRTADDDVQLF